MIEIGGETALEVGGALGEQARVKLRRASLQRPSPLGDQRGDGACLLRRQLGPRAREFGEHRQVVVVAERRSQPMQLAHRRAHHRRPRRLEHRELAGEIDDPRPPGVQFASASRLGVAASPRRRAAR